ncbi:protein FAM117A [Anolis carolinensis]|uniref:Family with sequence similarity 117 member A n=1 Tax=Anolis carolinensis TaxID=28377 RepID=G1KDF4_ANOCA|nr:PREDICTED: protein FAM117A [Anolis carolinensis]|eukprot:XP_003222709.1 PREDICTED: protein FAM117A [Anolis carolinensis]
MAAGTSSYYRGGLQPLKATVPFQLQHRRSGDGGRAASVPCAVGPIEKASRSKPPRVRRTSSLDNVLGSYLLGQWPRDADGAAIAHMSDKSTQTPVSWHDTGMGRATVHKRSASWSSVDHRREIAKLKQQLQRTKLGAYHSKEKDQSSPVQGDHTVLSLAKALPPASFPALATVSVSPCLHNSSDAINQELEEVFVKEQGDEELLRILDVPDGHRAPVPLQGATRDSLLLPVEHSSSSCSSLSLSPSPSSTHRRSPHTPARTAAEEHSPGVIEKPLLEAKAKENSSTSPVLAFALSPRPNHTYVFKREPPEGCEKVRAFEEVVPLSPDQPFQPSCPDKNKVHFNPTGSAFCQFSLVKPLIPSVDFLFRDFSTSSPLPAGTFSTCQPTSTVPVLSLQKDSRGDNFNENPPSPPLGLESWKRHQAEETVLFHSSLVA